MSDQPFLKCACQSCGGAIEFPGQGVGLSVQCPHCSQKTLLTDPVSTPAAEAAPPPVTAAASVPPPRPVPQPPAPASAPKSSKSPVLMVLLLLVVCGVVAGGAVWFFKFGPGAKPRAIAWSPDGPASGSTPVGEATNADPSPKQPSPDGKPAKSIDDLKASPVKLEKAKSGSLMYAVGTVKNDSDLQRFGVKVEIAFTDAKGNPAGKTTDYIQVIEPRQEWRFRALVLDSKAVRGQVAGISEDK